MHALREVNAAAEYLQGPLDLVHWGEEVAAAGAYQAVETLAWASISDHDWRKLGDALDAGGLGLSGDDLMQLWASCQLYRHFTLDPRVTRRARKILSDLSRAELTPGNCCWRAAEVIEAYISTKTRGLL